MTRQVEFADTDMAGIMHFANFFRFMEVTEHAFYRSLGFTVHAGEGAGAEGDPGVSWPRVNVGCEFFLPLRFEDEVEIELLVEEIRNKSIRYRFHFWLDGDERRLAAAGRMTAACVEMPRGDEGMRAVPIPDAIRSKIEQAPADLLKPA